MGFWSKIFGTDADAEKIAESNARLDELNRDRYGADYRRLDASQDGTYEDQVDDEFYTAVGDQADKLRRGADNFITGTLATTLRLVPVWAWLALAAVALFYLWPILGPRLRRLFA